jgi:outer membrane protein TolC
MHLPRPSRNAFAASMLFYMAATPLFSQTAAVRGKVVSPLSPVSVSATLETQSPYLGSVPTGRATGTVIPLSLGESLDRGLKYNLGLIESDVRTRTARAERLKNLSELLPNVNASISQTAEQVNLRALGLKLDVPGFPVVVGPFGVEDARAYWSQKIFDWNAVQKLRASQKSLQASDYSYKNSRDLVILAVANAYLQVISDRATIESQQAQLDTSRALYQRAVDQTKAGVAARIDELRANVELQTQQQRLIAAQNQFSKDALTLGRTIGLPPGQEFTLTDDVPYAPFQ